MCHIGIINLLFFVSAPIRILNSTNGSFDKDKDTTLYCIHLNKRSLIGAFPNIIGSRGEDVVPLKMDESVNTIGMMFS